jgi:hypothetical protein
MWTSHDWTSWVIGWLSGTAAYALLPESGFKILIVFLLGFFAAWIVRTA